MNQNNDTLYSVVTENNDVEKDIKRLSLIYYFYLLFGVIVCTIGVIIFFVTNHRTRGFNTTEGIAVEQELLRDEEGNRSYFFTYEYRVNGVVYRITNPVACGGAFCSSIGDTRNVRYNPDNPEEAVLVGVAIHTIMIVVGIITALASIVAILHKKKQLTSS